VGRRAAADEEDSSCLEVKEVSVSLVWHCNYAGIISSLFSLSNESEFDSYHCINSK
jgi:hypothetical protein